MIFGIGCSTYLPISRVHYSFYFNDDFEGVLPWFLPSLPIIFIRIVTFLVVLTTLRGLQEASVFQNS
ncbi:hypothetical protein L596_008344 [Steinernema carpocapsae]|uniref:Uncharacterized protein n=1 Tax=Steinernema carpocapsae TaxID=34508 RepID=A0A4U5PCG4_STECR|nr:hypothetical protein L596_008344 [Steinernema carpocapsae]